MRIYRKLKRWLEEKHHIFWHWQNLSKDDRGIVWRSGFWHGRAWLYLPRNHLGISWNFGKFARFCHAYTDVNGDMSEVVFSLGLPYLFTFWFHITGVFHKYRHHREIGIHIHSGAFWWRVWTDPDSWGKSTPKWRDGNFNPADFILGRHKYSDVDIETVAVDVPMPELNYRGTARVFLSEWKRPRWPWPRRLIRTEIEIPGGIPIPGKGENDWDQDDDKTYSSTGPYSTTEEAVAALVHSTLKRRERYGGKEWQPS